MLKKNITKANRRHPFIIIVCTLFVGVGALLAATWYQYQLNPDATSYFTIAQKYAHGDIKNAVNGYWSPMLSWLLVPFVWLGTNLIVAAKIVNVAIGAGILVTLYFALRTSRVEHRINCLVTLAAVPILLHWSVLESVTPDLLFALFVLLFTIALLRFMAQPKLKNGILLGAIGSGMYFTKAVGFYLFLGILAVVAGWQWRKHAVKPKILARQYAPVLIVFVLLIAPFVGLLSLKYDRITINTGAGYNFSVVGPHLQWHHPLSADAYAPPNDTALGAWEDPTRLTPSLPKWSPLESTAYTNYYLQSILLKNAVTFIEALYTFGPLIAAGIMLFICGAFGSVWRREYRLFVIISAALVTGYSLIALEDRYIWAIGIFGLISIGLFAQHFYAKKALSLRQILLAGSVVIAVSFAHLGYVIDTTKHADKFFYEQAVWFKKFIPEGSHILADDYNLALFACWHAKLRCYGTLTPPAEADYSAYLHRLQSMGTLYYISYKPESRQDENLQRFLDRYFTVRNEGPRGIVYKLSDNKN
jgi:hypothetical protein